MQDEVKQIYLRWISIFLSLKANMQHIINYLIFSPHRHSMFRPVLLGLFYLSMLEFQGHLGFNFKFKTFRGQKSAGFSTPQGVQPQEVHSGSFCGVFFCGVF